MLRKQKVTFIEQLLASSMVLDRHIDSFFKDKTKYGLSQIKILMSIHRSIICKKAKLCSQSVVARLWGVSEAAISRQVVILEHDKLITKVFDPNEKRRVILRLTAKGVRLVEKTTTLLDKELTRVFRPLSENSKKQLALQLEKVLESLSTNTNHYEITDINNSK